MWKLRSPFLQRARFSVRHIAIIFVILFAVANVVLWHDTQFWDAPGLRQAVGVYKHPIKKLMRDGRTRQEETLKHHSHDVREAAARYRTQRGRHPPPGFDRWFKAALDTKVVVVEDYFDRIYKDLTPYWALDARTLKKRASAGNSWLRSEMVLPLHKATSETECRG